jgi:hypothetical protein
MANGKWQMADGKGQRADGKGRMAKGGDQVGGSPRASRASLEL